MHSFDGTNWNSIPVPQNQFLLSWIRLKINSQDQPVVLVNEFPSQAGYSRVYEYDGTEWQSLGDRINPDKWTSGSASSLHQLALGEDDEPYVIIGHNDGSNVYGWNGSEWDTLAENIDNGVRENFNIQVGEMGMYLPLIKIQVAT